MVYYTISIRYCYYNKQHPYTCKEKINLGNKFTSLTNTEILLNFTETFCDAVFIKESSINRGQQMFLFNFKFQSLNSNSPTFLVHAAVHIFHIPYSILHILQHQRLLVCLHITWYYLNMEFCIGPMYSLIVKGSIQYNIGSVGNTDSMSMIYFL